MALTALLYASEEVQQDQKDNHANTAYDVRRVKSDWCVLQRQ
jgi:hypothetical protein